MTFKDFFNKGLAELAAAGRQGQKELAQILPAFNDGIKPVEEPGTLGNPVQREVYEQAHPENEQHARKAPEMEMGD